MRNLLWLLAWQSIFAVTGQAAMTVEYVEVPGSVDFVSDASGVMPGGRFRPEVHELRSSAYSLRKTTVQPDWASARLVFSSQDGYLEVPVSGGAINKTVQLTLDRAVVASVSVVLVASPLKIKGPYPFLQQMALAGAEGKDQHCTISPYRINMVKTERDTFDLFPWNPDPGKFASADLGQPSRCETPFP